MESNRHIPWWVEFKDTRPRQVKKFLIFVRLAKALFGSSVFIKMRHDEQDVLLVICITSGISAALSNLRYMLGFTLYDRGFLAVNWEMRDYMLLQKSNEELLKLVKTIKNYHG